VLAFSGAGKGKSPLTILQKSRRPNLWKGAAEEGGRRSRIVLACYLNTSDMLYSVALPSFDGKRNARFTSSAGEPPPLLLLRFLDLASSFHLRLLLRAPATRAPQ
jgi:hypothetical protein